MIKNKQQNSLSISYITTVVTAVVALLALTVALVAIQRIQTIENDSMKSASSLQGADARIRFCHDNQIVPCDEPSITKWNTEHSEDERFNLSR